MRASHVFLPPYRKGRGDSRQDPTALLLEGGHVRKTGDGLYAFLPLGMLMLRNLYQMVFSSMRELQGQEVVLPFLNSRGLWEASGRDRLVAADLLELRTGDGQELIINPSHEEAMIGMLKDMIHHSWQLPQFFYQTQRKGRDRVVAKHGMLHAREFITADGFSVHKSFTELNNFIPQAFNALKDLFESLGLRLLIAEGSGHQVGGDRRFDFILRHRWGDYQVVLCERCNYVADQRVAQGKTKIEYGRLMPMETETNEALTGLRSLVQAGVPESRIARCQLFAALDGLVMAVCRSDQRVSLEKLGRIVGDRIAAALDPDECREYGFDPDFMSPLDCNLDELRQNGVRVVVDGIAAETPNLVMGANAPGAYVRNANFGRDFEGHYTGDIAMVDDRHHCVHCDGPLRVASAFEIASINRLNDYYPRKLKLEVKDDAGATVLPWLGTYKIDVFRLLCAVAWLHQDRRGLLLPLTIAPYKACLVVVGKSGALHRMAEGLHQVMSDLLLWDERPLRFVDKIRDADRVGIPMRVVVSARSLKDGTVGLMTRRDARHVRLPAGKLKAAILHEWKTERERMGCSDEV